MARVKSSPEHWDIPKSVVFAPTGSDATISYAKSCPLSGSVAMGSVNKPRSFAPFCGLKMPRSYVLIIVPRSSRSYTALSFRDSLKFLLNTGFLFFACSFMSMSHSPLESFGNSWCSTVDLHNVSYTGG